MPQETKKAIGWALQQTFMDELGNVYPVTSETPQQLVDNVCLYFDTNNISYSTFSYNDLITFI